jgi:tyrosinase
MVTVGAAGLHIPLVQAQAGAKYKRHNVTSSEGKKALASYARGVEAMLRLPADHPQNWFRNAFVHLMDCPHGNWWFYVWHRGYVGYFEQTIRNLSGDAEFAMPYWDWTTLPQIPDQMFDGVLTPHDSGFEPYTRDLEPVINFIPLFSFG